MWDDTQFPWPHPEFLSWRFIRDEYGDENSKEYVLSDYSQFCSQLDLKKVVYNTKAEETLYLGGGGLIIPRILDEELT